METVADEALLLALLNSAPVVDGEVRDELPDDEAARAWLAEHAREHAPARAAGLRDARAGLAAVVRGTAPPASLAPLLAGVVRRPAFTADGLEWTLEGGTAAVRAVLAWDALRVSAPGRLRAVRERRVRPVPPRPQPGQQRPLVLDGRVRQPDEGPPPLRTGAQCLIRDGCCRSTSACRRTCRGRAGPSTRACGSTRSTDRGWCARSTSTATVRATSAGTAARCAPSWSTSASPTTTGARTSAATTWSTASSARTSPSTACPTTRCASATATGSARRSSRSPSPGSPASASACGSASRGCPHCSSPTTGPASTCASSARAACEAGDEIVRTRTGRHALSVADIDALLYLPGRDPRTGCAPRSTSPR